MASRSLRLLVLVALLAVLARSPHLGLVPRRGVSAAAAALWGGAPFAARCAWAEVALKEEAPLVQGRQDEYVAKGNAYGMVNYERAVATTKKALFKELFGLLPPKPVILDVGIGSFPNAVYLGNTDAPPEMDIVGVDPNEFMKKYALENAKKAGILTPERGNSLRLVRGIAERLPVADQSADAVVCTLTLCSVKNPQKALSEIRRALKPRSGKYLFVEHVLSETNPFFATAQRLATPEHVQAADGCHFDRQTLQTIQEAGFAEVKGDYFELDNCGFLNPTVAGLATA
ncbi:unnamed protein product [Durusdinium trenchii]|uniref:Methyltransferase type 11 domain-containing protein n=1 Tax=Durusdinium trenchii TaxID=1381693 RepID=A0ABP0QJQ7_9DINO